MQNVFEETLSLQNLWSQARMTKLSHQPFFLSHLTDKPSRWEDPAGRGGSASGDGSQGNGSGSNIPSLLSMATRSHMDITTPPLPQVCTLESLKKNIFKLNTAVGRLEKLHFVIMFAHFRSVLRFFV